MNLLHGRLVNRMLLGLIVLVISNSFCFGQSKDQQLNDLINQYLEYGKFNGSVLIADDEQVVYKKGFGLANIELDIPNQPNTKHRIGSITKQFTAMLILQLAANRKLDLHAPISKYLPDYPKEKGDKITIHHLLTHSSGIPNYYTLPGFYSANSRIRNAPEQFVEKFQDADLEFIPGEKYNYSNSGYYLLGIIIEKLTEKTYAETLQDNILTPLGMVDTGYENHRVLLKNRANGYAKRGNDFVNSGYQDLSFFYAAGAMYSTVEDLYTWNRALNNNQLLPEEYMDLFFKPHISAFGEFDYAYGWTVGNEAIGNTGDSITAISHSGVVNGFSSVISRSETDHSLIVVLNNTGRAPLDELVKAIRGIMYETTYDLPKKSLANDLLEVLETKGPEACALHFKTNKEADRYELNEHEMNLIGYRLMSAGKLKEAAQILKLNVTAFPKSANTYDSYAEVLKRLGNKEEAIKNYKKSVELNPANQHGIDQLKALGVDVDDRKN